MRTLLIDNYDSFTYNLYQLLCKAGARDVDVIRNDKITTAEAALYDGIVLSPGPGLPSEAGSMPLIVNELAAHKPILGVCLGHQCIAETFGASLVNLKQVMHGKETKVRVVSENEPIFAKLPKEFRVGRYHSWIVSSEQLPSCLEVTAQDENGQIMALRHKKYSLVGLQFHPESIMTEHGQSMLQAWIEDASKRGQQ